MQEVTIPVEEVDPECTTKSLHVAMKTQNSKKKKKRLVGWQ